MLEMVTPFPRPETTPPETTIYFISLSCYFVLQLFVDNNYVRETFRMNGLKIVAPILSNSGRTTDVERLITTFFLVTKDLFHFSLVKYFYDYLLLDIFSIRTSTTVGSARVDVSPRASISPLATFRRMRRMIFPDRVRGNADVGQIISGVAKGPIAVRTAFLNCLIKSSLSS